MKKFSIIFGSLIFLVFAVFSVIYIAYDTHEHTFVDMKNNSFHWTECSFCHFVPSKSEHVNDGTDNCSLCHGTIGPTEGLEYEINGAYARVTKYNGDATKIHVAPKYHGHAVTEIGENAFKNSKIVEIYFPNYIPLGSLIGAGLLILFADTLINVFYTMVMIVLLIFGISKISKFIYSLKNK